MIYAFVAGIVIFIVALIWSAHCQLWGMTLNEEIKPLEVLGLAVNIAIAFLLQFYLANKTTDLRSEKDILMGSVADALNTLKGCRDALMLCHGKEKIPRKESTNILQLFRRLSNDILHLEEGVSLSQCSAVASAVEEIWRAHDEYKCACTNAPFPTRSTPATEQDRTFRKLSKQLQRIGFQINKFR